jgi:hypothetical protein
MGSLFAPIIPQALCPPLSRTYHACRDACRTQAGVFPSPDRV